MASIFDRLFGKKAEKKPEIPSGGLIEHAPSRLPAEAPPSELFEILAPPETLHLPSRKTPSRTLTDVLVPGEARELPPPEPAFFEIIQPPAAPARPRTLTEVFFPEGAPLPRAEQHGREAPGFFDLFTVEKDPWDIERESRGIPSKRRLDEIVHLSEILKMVEEGRRAPAFQREVRQTLKGKPPAELPLIMVAPEEKGAEEKVAAFLGLPWSDVERIIRSGGDPWVKILNPMLYEVERGLEWTLGDKVPGVFHFGVNDRGEFGLFYLEDHPDL